MSADPLPPDPSAFPPPDRSDEAGVSEYLPQKRRYKKPDPTTASLEGAADPENEIIVLSSLLQALLARKQQQVAAPSQKTEAKAKVNRFVPKNAGARPDVMATESTTRNVKTPVADQSLPKLTLPTYQPENRFTLRSINTPLGRGVIIFLFTVVVAMIAFLSGRANGRKSGAPSKSAVAKGPATAAAPPWTPPLLGQLNQVLDAERKGELDQAMKLAGELKSHLGESLELDLYLAGLRTRLGDAVAVESDLSKILTPDTPLPTALAVQTALGFNYTRQRDFARASESFAYVAGVDPFSPMNFYQWGEALRRQGRLAEAFEKFDQAIRRLPTWLPEYESQRECAALKGRLCLIEMGKDAELKTAVEKRLLEPSPSGYWLLAGAAVALQHDNNAAGADALKRARAVMPPNQYNALLDDYFFHAFVERPGLAELLPPNTLATQQQKSLRTGYFIDP